MKVKLFEEFINDSDSKIPIFCTCGKVIDVTQEELNTLEDMGYVFLGGENEYTFEERDYVTILKIIGKYPDEKYPEF